MSVASEYEIEFACGHVEDRDLSAKPAGDRAGFASWLAKTKWTSCWQRSSKREVSKEVAAERESKLQAVREDQERSQLPLLQGSDKQVPWATDVRYGLLQAAYAELVEIGGLSDDEFDSQVLEFARKVDRAKWWIDNKDVDVTELLELLADPGSSASGTLNKNPY